VTGAVRARFQRHRASEIQRRTIAVRSPRNSSRAITRNVLRRKRRTQPYRFIQATSAITIPITLRIDIIPAGMKLPVWMNAGRNRPASRMETIPASTRPATTFPGSRNAATSNRMPEIEPATIDAMLPLFTNPMMPPTIVSSPKTMKYILAGPIITFASLRQLAAPVYLAPGNETLPLHDAAGVVFAT